MVLQILSEFFSEKLLTELLGTLLAIVMQSPIKWMHDPVSHWQLLCFKQITVHCLHTMHSTAMHSTAYAYDHYGENDSREANSPGLLGDLFPGTHTPCAPTPCAAAPRQFSCRSTCMVCQCIGLPWQNLRSNVCWLNYVFENDNGSFKLCGGWWRYAWLVALQRCTAVLCCQS